MRFYLGTARRRHLTVGVALSATVGNALDSWLFLTLAFGSTVFFWGQFWGKTEMILVGVLLTADRRVAFPVREEVRRSDRSGCPG